MRASPAFRIRVRRFGLWRAAVAALLGCTVAAQAAWLAGRADDMPPAALAALVALDAVVMVAAAGAWRVRPVELWWDTQRWHLGGASGRLAVALDLGGWMLLRFDPEAPGGRQRRIAWLPVQRSGLQAHWHALRCAVYCARPALGTDAGTNPLAGPESQE